MPKKSAARSSASRVRGAARGVSARKKASRTKKAAPRGRPHRPPALRSLSIEELEQQGNLAFWSGSFGRAESAFAALLARLERAGRPDDAVDEHTQAVMEIRRAAALRRTGALRRARAAAEHALAFAPGSRGVHVSGHALLSELHLLMGNLPLAVVAADKAVELCEGLDDKLQAWAVCAKARHLWAAKDFDQARETFLEAEALAARGGDEPNAVQIWGNEGMCLLELGLLPEAREAVGRAAEHAARLELPALEATWLVGLSRIALAEGTPEEAAQLAERALALARPLDLRLTVFRAAWMLQYLYQLAHPGETDRTRLSALRRMRPALAEYEGDREVQDLRTALSSRRPPEAPVASFTEGCDPVPR